MENAEEILQCLDEFSKMKPKDIPRELEEYLCFVARTGDPVYQWSLIKCLFREKLINVITDFYESCPSVDIPPCPNVEAFNFENMKNFILEKLETFVAAPFTVQRICELLTTPRKEYNRIDKYMRALEKNILVVSTREPGNRRSTENGESMLNGIEGEEQGLDGSNSGDVHVEIEMEDGQTWPKTTTEGGAAFSPVEKPDFNSEMQTATQEDSIKPLADMTFAQDLGMSDTPAVTEPSLDTVITCRASVSEVSFGTESMSTDSAVFVAEPNTDMSDCYMNNVNITNAVEGFIKSEPMNEDGEESKSAESPEQSAAPKTEVGVPMEQSNELASSEDSSASNTESEPATTETDLLVTEEKSSSPSSDDSSEVLTESNETNAEQPIAAESEIQEESIVAEVPKEEDAVPVEEDASDESDSAERGAATEELPLQASEPETTSQETAESVDAIPDSDITEAEAPAEVCESEKIELEEIEEKSVETNNEEEQMAVVEQPVEEEEEKKEEIEVEVENTNSLENDAPEVSHCVEEPETSDDSNSKEAVEEAIETTEEAKMTVEEVEQTETDTKETKQEETSVVEESSKVSAET